MSGIEAAEEMTADQIDAMAGQSRSVDLFVTFLPLTSNRSSKEQLFKIRLFRKSYLRAIFS